MIKQPVISSSIQSTLNALEAEMFKFKPKRIQVFIGTNSQPGQE